MRAKPSVAMALMVSTLGLGMLTASNALASGSSGRAVQPTYSGEQIFRAVFFHEGTLAVQHPEIAMVPDGPSFLVQPAIDRLVGRMRAQDPTFFDQFGMVMRSGDHARMEAELGTAEAHLRNAAPQHGTSAYASPQGVYVWLEIFVVAVAVIFLAHVNVTGSAAPATRMGREMLVSKITRALSTRPRTLQSSPSIFR